MKLDLLSLVLALLFVIGLLAIDSVTATWRSLSAESSPTVAGQPF